MIVQSDNLLMCFAKGPSKDYKAILKGVKIYLTYWIVAAFTELRFSTKNLTFTKNVSIQLKSNAFGSTLGGSFAFEC